MSRKPPRTFDDKKVSKKRSKIMGFSERKQMRKTNCIREKSVLKQGLSFGLLENAQ